MARLRREWIYLKKNGELLILSLPAVVWMAIFSFAPMIGLLIAFKRYRYDLGILGSEWVGLKNFEFFFTSRVAGVVTRNTVLYNLGFFFITTVVSLTFAILLNELSRSSVKLYQTSMFLPYFLSWVVVSYIVLAFLDSQHGYVNQLLEVLGFEAVKWYFKPKYWPYILNIVHLWKSVGFSTLVYYAGIMGIDPEYYEAAIVDGASKWQLVRHITLPLLSPLVIVLFILALGGIFRGDFGLFFFVPSNSSFLFATTDIIDTYVYRALTRIADLGMGTAVGLYQSVVGLITVVVANHLIRKVAPERALW
jgi:putative aldouronate transport system permease protein